MALRTPLSVTPHLYMGDSTGRPLDKGVVYFGKQDKDPEFYPINLFSDDARTLPLAQPVHTKGGYLYDKGDMVEPHAKEIIYSVKVLDSYGRKVFYKGAMMRNSWNDDIIEQINAAIVASTDIARQVATDITKDAINNTAVEGGVLADTFVTATAKHVGAIPRTQADKNSDIVSVQDFYSGDWNEAFDKALATGRKVNIGEGVHEITRSIKLPSNTVLQGAGKGKSIVKFTGTAKTMPEEGLICNATVSGGDTNIHIMDFTVDGNVHSFADPTKAGGLGSRRSNITFRGVVGGSISRIESREGYLHGIDITYGSLDYEVTGDAPEAPLPNPSRNILIQECDVYDYGDDAITTHHSENLFIINNYCHDSRRTVGNNNGIEIDDGSRHVYISGNITERNSSGIEVKAHAEYTAPYDVVINGHVSRNDRMSYSFRHLGHMYASEPITKSAYNITASNLSSYNINNDKKYYPDDPTSAATGIINIVGYHGVNINGVTAWTDVPDKCADQHLIMVRYMARNVNISNVSFKGFTKTDVGIYVVGGTDRADNVHISNVVAENSCRYVVKTGSNVVNYSITNVHADANGLVGASNVVNTTSSNGTVHSITGTGYPHLVNLAGTNHTEGLTVFQNAFRAASSSSGAISSSGAVVASAGTCSASGSKSFVASSLGSNASGDYSTVLGSNASDANGSAFAAVIASKTSKASASSHSAVIASENSTVASTGAKGVILASKGVGLSRAYSVSGGFDAVAVGSVAATKWELDSFNGTIKATGAITGSSVFTDYAEYFESLDGTAIPTGTIVTLDGDKIRPANTGEYILGVISETAGVVLGEASWAWSGRYLRNEFGGLIYEDVEHTEEDGAVITMKQPKVNPDYTEQDNYKSRADRDEWNIVGLLGQLYVRIDDTVEVGSGIDADNGIATKGSKGVVMQITKKHTKKTGYGVAKLLLK